MPAQTAEKPIPHKVIQGKWDYAYHAWRVEDAKRWGKPQEDVNARADQS